MLGVVGLGAGLPIGALVEVPELPAVAEAESRSMPPRYHGMITRGWPARYGLADVAERMDVVGVAALVDLAGLAAGRCR